MLDTNPKTRIKAAALYDEIVILTQQPIKTEQDIQDTTVEVLSKKEIPATFDSLMVIRQRKDIIGRRPKMSGLPLIPKRL